MVLFAFDKGERFLISHDLLGVLCMLAKSLLHSFRSFCIPFVRRRSFLIYVTVRFHGYGDGYVIFNAGHRVYAENIFWLEVREVNTLQGYHPGKKSFSQPPKIVKDVQIE